MLEPLLREAVYDRILRPLCARYIGQDALPEHLRFSDTFFVKYEADGASAQTGLSVHTDGSTFSFNVLLSDPADFEGGGTFIEPARATVRPRRPLVQGCNVVAACRSWCSWTSCQDF